MKNGSDEEGGVRCGQHISAAQRVSIVCAAVRAGRQRPALLKGLRVAHDPTTERVVVVHSGARVEFLMVLPPERNPTHADVECRRIGGTGASETSPIATFQFDETGKVSQSTVPELVGESVIESNGAWSIVWAVVWSALQG